MILIIVPITSNTLVKFKSNSTSTKMTKLRLTNDCIRNRKKLDEGNFS